MGRLRYFVPSTNPEYNEIASLGEKTKLCWFANTNAASTETVKTAIDNESCLRRAVGDNANKEINQGMRRPSYDEQLRFNQCYGSARNTASVAYYKSDENLTSQTDSCLKSTLGNLYSKVKSGLLDVPPDYREKVNKCFGFPSQPFIEGAVYKVPDEIRSCLKDAVGEARFNQFNEGSQPNSEERQKTNSCFAKLNKIQAKFLPPPPEQVPFIEEKTDVIQLADIKQETQTVNNKTRGGKVVMGGKGPKDSTVTIYIYSDPIVVTTKTDKNGDWVYELNQPLSGEKHVAYALVKSKSGNVVRSSVFDFTVVAAENDLENRLQDEGSLINGSSGNFIKIALVVVGLGALTVFIFYAYNHFFKMKKALKEAEDLKSKEEEKDHS